MGGGKDVSQIAPYMGTNQDDDDDDDKGSLWAWEFLFARCFFFSAFVLGPVQVQPRLLGPYRGRTGSFFWKICSVGLFVPSVFRLLLIIRCFVSITSSHHRMHMPWPKVKAIVVPGIPLALPLPLRCLCLYLYSNFVSCCSFFITFLVVVMVSFCTWRRPQDLLSCGQRLLL